MPIVKPYLKKCFFFVLCCYPLFIIAKPTPDDNQALVVIEAEHFATQHLDNKRRWVVFTPKSTLHNYQDPDRNHSNKASNNSYIEVLPDTRVNHYDDLVHGENFSNTAGQVAVLSYPTYFAEAGEYVVWVRAFSTGSEDNGVHIGLNGAWPESGQRVQLCEGKHKWTWSSAQRIESNHCGKPKTITLTIPSKGVHNIIVSMREDGFELDQLLLTKNKHFNPEDHDYAETLISRPPLPTKQYLLDITEYNRIIYASDEFDIENTGGMPYYSDEKNQSIAIDSATHLDEHEFAYAKYTVKPKEKGTYTLSLVTLSELEGESLYRVLLNDTLLAEFKNPVGSIKNKEIVFNVDAVSLLPDDVITIASKATSNGTLYKNNHAVYSKGRWRALVLKRSE
jgi:hypothetical protein